MVNKEEYIMLTLNQALDNAWKEIQKYCKENYAGKTTRDIQFSWKHDTYGWLEFGVTPNGTAYFVRGGHHLSHRSKDADWYYHPDYKEGYYGTKYREMEQIIKDWKKIKNILEQKFAVEDSIFNFKI